MFNISLQYPAWFLLLCISLGAVYAFALYYKDTFFKDAGENFRKWLWGLAALRFAAATIVALLLLSPLLHSSSSNIEKPIVLIAQDNSESVKMNWKKDDSLNYINTLHKLINELSNDYDVKEYSIGSKVREGMELNFTDKSTNLSDFFEQTDNLYSNQNLGAVILASDGVFNEGSNPVYANEEKTVPVYTIGMGDTTLKRDLILSKVYSNKVAYLGNNFSIRTDITAQNCNSEQTILTVSKIEKDQTQKLFDKTISIGENFFQTSADFILKADKSGIQHYRLSLSHLKNEATYLNNEKDIYIEVLDAKQKILIVANAPHPDIAAIKQAIESNQNYQTDVKYANTFSGNINDYSLVILHQLPSVTQSASALLTQIKTQKKSVLFILGAQTGISILNNVQNALVLNSNTNQTNEVQPSLVKDFSLFTLNNNTVQTIESFPPLISPFGDYRLSQNASVFAYQKIGTVTTKYPLIFFNQELDYKMGMICGEGIWRWRTYDFMQHRNFDAFNELITRFIQYLSVKENKKQFSVTLERNNSAGGGQVFSENQPVVFNAELYNETFELTNQPDVMLTIRNEAGKEFPYIFNKTENAYTLNAGYFSTGNYSYEASVKYANKNLTASGNFTISPVQLEAIQTRADHQLLNLLSAKTGGKFFYPNQLDELVKQIKSQDNIKPVIYTTDKIESAINLKWIFFLITGLLSIEWFVRKYNGGY